MANQRPPLNKAQKEAVGNTARYKTLTDLFREEGILKNDQVQYMMMEFAKEDDKKAEQ